MSAIVYGDFNCPFSRLASDRVDTLQERGMAFEWRAVQHEPDMPPEGRPVEGSVREQLDDHEREIGGCLRSGEHVDLSIGPIRPNTAAASAAHAALSGEEADAYRRQMFDAIWSSGEQQQVSVRNDELADRWQRTWEVFERRYVPFLIEDDGTEHRGIEALHRLAALLDG